MISFGGISDSFKNVTKKLNNSRLCLCIIKHYSYNSIPFHSTQRRKLSTIQKLTKQKYRLLKNNRLAIKTTATN